MRTLTLENDKLVKFTETSAKKIESNMAIVSREIESLELKYPGVKTATITKARDQGKARPWLDSLQQQLFRLKEIDTAFGTMYENSKFNSVLTDVSYLNYLMRFNAEVIKFNSHVNNSQIAEIDSVICERSAHSIMLYKDSVRLEVINNNVIGIVKKAKLYTRSAMTEYKSSKRSDSNPNDILQIQNELLSILELAQKVNMNCLNFNKEVLSVMKNYNEIKSLNQLAKNQKKLKEDKNDFIIEESKMASERDRKLSEEISDNSRRWKKIFTAKMNEQ